MKKFFFSHIRRWLMLLLALVVLTTIATYLLTYIEINRTLSNYSELSVDGPAVSNKGSDYLTGLKIRLLLLLSGSTLLICGLGYVWIGFVARRLNQPLHLISMALAQMSRGKLTETVTIETPDELSQIATGINELAANLQELLLYIWKQSGQCLDKLNQLEVDADSDEPSKMTATHLDHLNQLNKAVHDLRDMAKAYVFYDVHLQDEKALAITEPGQSELSPKKKAPGVRLS
jgi:methyl-accepting chemotaxis protein